LSEIVKPLISADVSSPRVQIDEASRLSLTNQAVSFARLETRELEVFIRHLVLVKACGLTKADYDDVTWTAIQVICHDAETRPVPFLGATTPRTATLWNSPLDLSSASARESYATGEEDITVPADNRKRKADLWNETGLRPTVDPDSSDVNFAIEIETKRTRVDEKTASIPDEFGDYDVEFANPTPEEKALRSKLQRYYDLQPINPTLVTQGMRFMAYIHTTYAQAGNLKVLRENLYLLEMIGADEQVIAFVFDKAYLILKSPEVAQTINLDDILDVQTRELMLAFSRQEVTEASFKSGIHRFCVDPRLVSPRMHVATNEKLMILSSWFLQRVKGGKFKSAQRILDLMYKCAVDIKRIGVLVRETCLYLKSL
jgi:hypothetical protein